MHPRRPALAARAGIIQNLAKYEQFRIDIGL